MAPGWASGQTMTEAEQQLVSACLAAHINKYGVHVPLSVLGRNAQSELIPYTCEELQSFPRREGCFFGNLFTAEGMFVGMDGASLMDEREQPARLRPHHEPGSLASQCSPIVHVESCESLCTLDPSGVFYTQCTYNGRTYQPLTTRIRSEDVFTCGDGVCQFTESCGTGNQANNCLSDCAPARDGVKDPQCPIPSSAVPSSSPSRACWPGLLPRHWECGDRRGLRRMQERPPGRNLPRLPARPWRTCGATAVARSLPAARRMMPPS